MGTMDKPESFSLRSPLSSLERLPDVLAAKKEQLSKVVGIACFSSAARNELCYCDRSPKSWREEDESVILCTPELSDELKLKCPQAQLIGVEDVRACFIDLTRELLASGQLEISNLIDRPLGIADSATIGAQSYLHPEVRIDEDVVIGVNCTIHRGVWIQRGVKIGDGAVVGASGINAYVSRDGRQLDFPHLAGVIIGENVSIGANAVIMRGILTSTRLGSWSTIGNLCNIGHGVKVGEKCWMSVGCLIGGHSELGNRSTLGMGVSIRDNLKIGEQSQIGMGSVVVKEVSPSSSVFGNPARPVPALSAGPSR
jgi:UDP-3-O-[3-hydroxymyristoyl] glucosamine N-acyltransferase